MVPIACASAVELSFRFGRWNGKRVNGISEMKLDSHNMKKPSMKRNDEKNRRDRDNNIQPVTLKFLAIILINSFFLY